ncbi:MAG: hypothetical protein KAR73_02200 [Spirochaetales bacterium]|nr:hypothetical protein [Spirochaetales bacterium]
MRTGEIQVPTAEEPADAPELGPPMPLPFERLTAQEKQILRDWISEGAKNN